MTTLSLLSYNLPAQLQPGTTNDLQLLNWHCCKTPDCGRPYICLSNVCQGEKSGQIAGKCADCLCSAPITCKIEACSQYPDFLVVDKTQPKYELSYQCESHARERETLVKAQNRLGQYDISHSWNAVLITLLPLKNYKWEPRCPLCADTFTPGTNPTPDAFHFGCLKTRNISTSERLQ